MSGLIGKTVRATIANPSTATTVNTTKKTVVLMTATATATKTKNQMANKPFDEDQYNADDNAKYDIIQWLERNRFTAWVNPDQYGIDVLADRDGESYGFEVEIKHNWQGDKFPYSTVHFSARKQKFIGWNHFFTMLNDDRTCVLVVDEAALRSAPVVEKSTKFTESELFIAVPKKACVVFRLD